LDKEIKRKVGRALSDFCYSLIFPNAIYHVLRDKNRTGTMRESWGKIWGKFEMGLGIVPYLER
jgi:hypothetical protein